jgi:glutaredoxin
MTRILKFEKNDCAPCTQVSEFLDRKGIAYETVNPFDKPELAIQFKVRTVPTVIVLEENQETKRIIGFKPEELSALESLAN